MSATKTKVQSIIDENAVAVFSKSYCPYCSAAKKLLSDKGAKFYAIELDQVGMYTHTPRGQGVHTQPQAKKCASAGEEAKSIVGFTANRHVDDGSAIQSTLKDITGQTTVPNIFIGQKHIGGNSELQAKKGDLATLLKDAGAA
jgi:glutaredoxin 3